MANKLGDDNEEVEQVFQLYDEMAKMLASFCEKHEDVGFNPICLATAVGMTLNDIADEIEETAPNCSVREEISGRVAHFIFVNKKMLGH